MTEYDTDVCIVGSGVAGILAAYQLQKQGYEVTVLEAGSWEDSITERIYYKLNDCFPKIKDMAFKIPGFTYPWVDKNRDRFINSGDQEYNLNKSRHKGVGGTVGRKSPIWHGWAIQPYPIDFYKDSEYGFGKDWPIGYNDLKPYYKKAERKLAVSGRNDNPYRDREEYPIQTPYLDKIEKTFAPVTEKHGVKLHTPPVATDPDSEKLSVYTTNYHINQATAEGVKIVSEAPVRRLQTDDSGKVIKSAVYTKGGDVFVLNARHFILAAGGVENARILLLSKNNAHPNGLANSSQCVGRYFMEHPMIKVSGKIESPDWGVPKESVDGELISHEHYYPSEENPHSIMLIFRKNSGDNVSIMAMVEVSPEKGNYVSINDSVCDDNNDPVPEISLSYNTENYAALERAKNILLKYANLINIKINSVSGPQNPVYPNHHLGTTRMGTDPKNSVVNKNLRSHDIDNLSIISSSVFPTGLGVNPTLTIVALGLRTVDKMELD